MGAERGCRTAGKNRTHGRWEEGKAHFRVRDAEAHCPSYGDRRDKTKSPRPWWPQSLLSAQPELLYPVSWPRVMQLHRPLETQG